MSMPETHCTGCVVDHDPHECGYRPQTIDPETGHYTECPAPEDFKGETACYCAEIEAGGR